MVRDRRWNYARVSRIWANGLVFGGAFVLISGVLLEFGDPKGDPGSWSLVAVGTAVPTAVLFFFLLRSWMRDGALPSARLPDAEPAGSLRRLPEPTRRQWSTWSVVLVAMITVGCLALTGFLVAVLGGGGTAEGVVVGVTVAWGVVTRRDVAALEAAQAAQQRRYDAVCRWPVSVAQELVWLEDAVVPSETG